jgi:hypothetical protein
VLAQGTIYQAAGARSDLDDSSTALNSVLKVFSGGVSIHLLRYESLSSSGRIVPEDMLL